MPFEFKKSTGKNPRSQRGVLNDPPATNRVKSRGFEWVSCNIAMREGYSVCRK